MQLKRENLVGAESGLKIITEMIVQIGGHDVHGISAAHGNEDEQPQEDPMLIEAAHILLDYVELSAPKIARPWSSYLCTLWTFEDPFV